jgi:hypothetical protein
VEFFLDIAIAGFVVALVQKAVVDEIVRIEDVDVLNGIALVGVTPGVPCGPRLSFGSEPPGVGAAIPTLDPETTRLSIGVVQRVDSGVLVSTERTRFIQGCFFLDQGKPCRSSISGGPNSHSRRGLIAMHKIRKARTAITIASWI